MLKDVVFGWKDLRIRAMTQTVNQQYAINCLEVGWLNNIMFNNWLKNEAKLQYVQYFLNAIFRIVF